MPWPLGTLDRAYLSLAGRFKTQNGLKIGDTDLLHLQSTANDGMFEWEMACFSHAETCFGVCLHYGFGYFRINNSLNPHSRMSAASAHLFLCFDNIHLRGTYA